MKQTILKFSSICLLILFFSTNIAFSQESFMFQGKLRQYIVHTPPGYTANSSLSLIINMHGYSSNALQQQWYSMFNAVADTGNFIVVYPEGINASWVVGFPPPATNSGVDDVAFISNLIDTLQKDYNIDLLRVYATGMSMGGYMSHRLACELSDRIVAIASVTGTMTDSIMRSCNPGRKVPVMQIHGTNDPTVAYGGSLGSSGIDSLVKFWAGINNCSSDPDTIQFPDLNNTDSSTAEFIFWDNCDEGVQTQFYKIHDGEHTWPGAVIDIGITNQDFHASVAIWNFFKQYSFETDPVGLEDQELHQSSMVYPNPVTNQITLDFGDKKVQELIILDLNGKIILENSGIISKSLDFSNYPAGYYLIKLILENESAEYPIVKI